LNPNRNSSRPRISLIVPAHNEERLLPRLLDSVDAARAAVAGMEVEVVVADNASTDRTAELARTRGCRVATVEKRAIAAARNGGAAAARGEILAFTDADGTIHPGTFAAIDAALASGRVVAGATGVTMERWSPGIAATYALLLPMVWLTRMDTGVVCCRREDFEAVGGYDERRLFGEDVLFLWQLRRRGRADGRRLARLRGVRAVASTRKFEEFGDWHYFVRMPAVAWRMLFDGSAANDFARRYWYQPRR
jgi:glycosyltransferase involved in cell wall biosynthesis